MTEQMLEHIVGVHIKADDTKPAPKKGCRIRATYNFYSIKNTDQPIPILHRAPNRRVAIIQIYTQGGILAASAADALACASATGSGSLGAQIGASTTVAWRFHTTEEMWAIGNNAAATSFAVIQEFEEEYD